MKSKVSSHIVYYHVMNVSTLIIKVAIWNIFSRRVIRWWQLLMTAVMFGNIPQTVSWSKSIISSQILVISTIHTLSRYVYVFSYTIVKAIFRIRKLQRHRKVLRKNSQTKIYSLKINQSKTKNHLTKVSFLLQI